MYRCLQDPIQEKLLLCMLHPLLRPDLVHSGAPSDFGARVASATAPAAGLGPLLGSTEAARRGVARTSSTTASRREAAAGSAGALGSSRGAARICFAARFSARVGLRGASLASCSLQEANLLVLKNVPSTNTKRELHSYASIVLTRSPSTSITLHMGVSRVRVSLLTKAPEEEEDLFRFW